MKLLLTAFLCCCAMVVSYAQNQDPYPRSNLRQKRIDTKVPVIKLDSNSLVPGTFRIPGVAASTYRLDEVNALLTWLQAPPLDQVEVSYRVFPLKLNAQYQRLRYDSIMNFFLAKPFVFNNNSKKEESFFQFGNINYSGSFGRGISFGNAQDAVVNSTLNLQLNGFLADSIEISAAITDNNIPIQPDGTTQQLNEFDRIFLQFKKKNWQLSMGDIDIRQNQMYFLQFYKRLQGAAFETTAQWGTQGAYSKTLVSGSIAKGKFTRNVFQGQEGNQGPYRLQGANNEFFFVILGGTERVFLDGVRLERGEDQDYVINYNTAEITFTPKRMISKDSRLQVEFEYADRNYLNANLFVSNTTQIDKRLQIRSAVFSNNDVRNSPINQTLDPAQKTFLAALGDSVQQAFYPIASLDTFTAGKILYKKIDTLINSQPTTIYRYSTDPDSARYSLSFVDVGQNKGNYIPDFNGANGKVYTWVPPINGVPQGNFEAAAFLVTPKKQQVISVGSSYQVDKHIQVHADLAYSLYDLNTFSAKDKSNDRGYATKIVVTHEDDWNSKQGVKKTKADLGFEWVDKRFRPLERLRNVEFTRDWGLDITAPPTEEKLYQAGWQLSDAKNNSIRYQINGYQRGDGFEGWRNSLWHKHSWKGWQINNQFLYTVNTSESTKGYFLRPTIDISKELKQFRLYQTGISYQAEHNQQKNRRTDSVTPSSFAFDILQFYLRSNPTNPNKWGFQYFTRSDQYPIGKNLIKADRSQNFSISAELMKNPKHQFRANATYRQLRVLTPNITNLKDEESLLARAEYMVNEWKGLLVGNLLYEAGAGQEQRRDFSYLEVPAGQGQYAWIDYNLDGVQQLNEFELAAFSDQARYIRIFTPTNQFVRANYNTFNYSLTIAPRALIDPYRSKGFKKIIARTSFQSALQLNRKDISNGLIRLNPFNNDVEDTALISLNTAFINTLTFNRLSTKWGFDLSNTRNLNKALLTYGLESRTLREWALRTRWNLRKTLTLEWIWRYTEAGLDAGNPKFENRNYQIEGWQSEPRLTFLKGTNFRWISSYRFQRKDNQEGANEDYQSHTIQMETKYNVLQNSSLQARASFQQIQFNGPTNTTVSYIMLDGLVPGKNILWGIDLTRRLGNSLELNLQYEGRKPGTTRTIHIGRASLRALL